MWFADGVCRVNMRQIEGFFQPWYNSLAICLIYLIHLSYYPLPIPSALSVLAFLCVCVCLLTHCPEFFLRDGGFGIILVKQLGNDSWWFIQHAAIWFWYLPLCFCIIFFNLLLFLSISFFDTVFKSCIHKSDGSPHCRHVLVLPKKGDIWSAIFFKICVCMFHCVFVSRLILWIWKNFLVSWLNWNK